MKQIITLILASVLVSGCSTYFHYSVANNENVELFLSAPDAKSVVLVISGNHFRKIEAVRSSSDIWKTTLMGSKEFRYFYLVDGRMYLPDCKFREKDDFGSDNCVFTP